MLHLKTALFLSLFSFAAMASDIALFSMGDKNRVSTQAVHLSQEEVAVLRSGVRQRAEALRLFFAETFIGSAQFWKSIPSEIRGEIISEEHYQALRTSWHGHSDTEISFFYGPDLFHTEAGFEVIEDNIGPIGGLGDIVASHQLYWTLEQKLLMQDFVAPQGIEFFIDAFLELNQIDRLDRGSVMYKRISHKAIAEIGALSRKERESIDLEAVRAQDLYEQMGIGRKAPELNEASAFLNYVSDPLQDPTLESFHSRRVPLLTSIGTELISNKLLLPYVDSMIQHFLHEDPILVSPASGAYRVRPIASTPWYELESISGHFPSPKGNELLDYVYKEPSSNRGEGVFLIGETLSGDPHEIFQDFVEEPSEPYQGIFLLQKRSRGKKVSGYTYDLRPHTLVTAGQVIVGQVPWSRIAIGKSKLTNISVDAAQAVVLTRKCEELLTH